MLAKVYPPPLSPLVLISLIGRVLVLFYLKEFCLKNSVFISLNRFPNYQNVSSRINNKSAKICLIDLPLNRLVMEPIGILDKNSIAMERDIAKRKD